MRGSIWGYTVCVRGAVGANERLWSLLAFCPWLLPMATRWAEATSLTAAAAVVAGDACSWRRGRSGSESRDGSRSCMSCCQSSLPPCSANRGAGPASCCPAAWEAGGDMLPWPCTNASAQDLTQQGNKCSLRQGLACSLLAAMAASSVGPTTDGLWEAAASSCIALSLSASAPDDMLVASGHASPMPTIAQHG